MSKTYYLSNNTTTNVLNDFYKSVFSFTCPICGESQTTRVPPINHITHCKPHPVLFESKYLHKKEGPVIKLYKAHDGKYVAYLEGKETCEVVKQDIDPQRFSVIVWMLIENLTEYYKALMNEQGNVSILIQQISDIRGDVRWVI